MYLRSALLVLLASFSAFESLAATRQMSFEEVTSQADLIVVGTVIANPDEGIIDATGEVYREQLIRIITCLAGVCKPGTITVRSPGGIVDAMVDGKMVKVEHRDSNSRRLPAPGTELLLFLANDGQQRNAYRVFSSTHGFRIIENDNGAKHVSLALEDPAILTGSQQPAAKRRQPYNESTTADSAPSSRFKRNQSGRTLSTERISVTELPELIARIRGAGASNRPHAQGEE